MIRDFILRKTYFSSQFFLAPINTGFSKDGAPNDELIKFHKERSGKSIGVSCVGNVAIHKDFVSNDKTLFFDCNSGITDWKKLANTISSSGSVPGIQLGCNATNILPMKNFISSNVSEYVKQASEEFSTFSQAFIRNIIQKFVDASIFAYNAGFKVIQLHAAHGYFLSLSLSNEFNKRADAFGDRTKILSLIINSIREKIQDVVLDVRVSLLEGIKEHDIEVQEKNLLFSEICKLDIDLISISNGIYNINKNLIYPNAKNGIYEDYGIRFAEQYPNKIWNIAGNIYNTKQLKGMQIKNLTYSIGRSLIADPLFVLKTSMNEEANIIACKKCNKCHYYSNNKKSLTGCLNIN